MKKKTRFLQKYFCLNPDEDFGYLVITEIVEGIPVGSFVVKIPPAFRFYEETHSYYATTPN